ncbi:hypothetical protein ACIBCU_37115 [Streptomyces sp. NPDC051064]|uniref:MmyB family transcriptional regulator n=1 Tax=Streptomyces sp. NPDC051064 TaxID=3365641 RepID=UPI0037A8890E
MGDPEFLTWWGDHRVAHGRREPRRFATRSWGELALDRSALTDASDPDLIALTAAHGTPPTTACVSWASSQPHHPRSHRR